MQSAASLRMLAAIASLSRLEDVTRRMERAAGILETGGVLTPKALERGAMALEAVGRWQELEGVFTGWSRPSGAPSQ